MLKKLIAMTLAFCLMFSMLPATQVSADTGYSEGLSYTLSKDGTYYTVSGIGECTDTDLVIPATFNGLPVTAIGDYAFQDCEQLTSVTLPDSITTIGNYAFNCCWSLAIINVPNGVTTIGRSAFENCESLTEIHIPASVTSIGDHAFVWCSKLPQITVDADNAAYCAVDGVLYTKDMTTLHTYPAGKVGASFAVPNTVTTIADYAFASCGKLTAITLPEGLLIIRSNAFLNCYNLKSIDISSTVTEIDSFAFQNCSGLTSVTIPASVRLLDWGVFLRCSNLTEILVETGNNYFCSVDGAVYTADMKTLVAYPVGKPDASFTIPAGTQTIHGYAFGGSEHLTEIILPDSMTSIANYALANCTNLQNVTIPANVTTIGNGAFQGCESLASIVIPNGVTRIENYTFSNCRSLTSVTIPVSVTYIGRSAFNWCQNLKEIRYAGSKAQWDAITKENNWDNRTGDYSISYSVFCTDGHTWTDATCAEPKHCVNCGLTEGIALGHNFVDDYCTVCGKCSYSMGLSYTLSKDGTSYIVSGIGNCTDTDLVIPSTYEGLPVTVIGDNAFQECTQLTSAILPDGITTIGDYAFASCGNLTEVILPEGLLALNVGVFECCYNLQKIEIPSTVLRIDRYAFNLCENLTSLTIPASVTDIDYGAFVHCYSLTEFVAEEGGAYCSVDGVLYTADKKTLVAYPVKKPDTSFKIPAGTENVSGYAFSGSMNLAEIILPDGVKTIGYAAFEGCSAITSIVIPNGVAIIESWAFGSCGNLTSITIPVSVTHIFDRAFMYSWNLTQILYGGTEEKWNAITKDEGWNFVNWDGQIGDYSISYSVFCTDGHTWADATCTAPVTCVNCGLTDGVALGHNYVDDICTRCGNFDYNGKLVKIYYPNGQTYVTATANGNRLAIGTNSEAAVWTVTVDENGYLIFACNDLYMTSGPNGNQLYMSDTLTDCGRWELTESDGGVLLRNVGAVYNGQYNQYLEFYRAFTTYGLNTNNLPIYTFQLIVVEGCEAYGHDWTDATCQETKYCQVCGAEGGNGDHNVVNGVCTLCGIVLSQGLEYTLSKDGTSYIVSGIGECADSDLVIPATYEGLPVTAIGNSAFVQCDQLTSVTLPSSVTTIGGWAFGYCWNLTDVNISSSVTSIGNYAFGWCYDLTSINIPNGVTTIGWGAFQQCESLTEIAIPASVTSIGDGAFGYCYSLSTIVVEEGNPAYSVVDGVLYTKDMTTLHTYPAGKAGTSFEIPYGITTINSGAFRGSRNLTGIIIPSSVTTIGDGAFSNCGITSITIPASVQHIGGSVFENCRGLVEILVEEDNANYCSVDGVLYTEDMSTLMWYPSAKADVEFTIPDGVVTIGQTAFRMNNNLQSVIIPNGVTTISYAAFNICQNLTSITIPNTVTYIGNSAFVGCSHLSTIYYIGTQAQWNAITKDAEWNVIDWDGNVGTFTIYFTGECETNGHTWADATCTEPKRCTACGTTEGEALGHDYADDVCTICGKYSYSIGLSYTLSEDGAYYIVSGIGECTDTELVIPATYNGLPVTAIGGTAFWNCEQLTSVTLPDSITTIGEYAFDSCYNMIAINIPNGVAVIESYAFQGCYALTTIDIPSSVTYIAPGAFHNCNGLVQISVDPDNVAYSSVDGVLYDKEMTILMKYPACKPGTSYVIPEGVVTIERSAFGYCQKLSTLILPETLTVIGDGAFFRCYDLQDIRIPDGVTEIQSDAFAYCSGLTSVTLPTSAASIGWGAFRGCSSLTEILVKEGSAYYCSLDGVVYTADMKTLVAYPVGKSDTSFTIPAGTEVIYGDAFYGSRNLTQIIFPDSLTAIENSAFCLCDGLTTIVIPNGVTMIESNAFYRCVNLATITIPVSVAYIGRSAFDYCQSLTDIYYAGTEEKWNAITKGNGWDNNTGVYTMSYQVFCTEGHTWGEWVITTAPTTEAAGEETRTCTQCGAQETRAIDKLVSETDPQIYMESVKAKAGDSITVNVYIKNNPGVMYLNLTLSYDPVVMTLVSVTNGELLDTMTSGTNIVWDATGNRTADGLLCTLEFRLSENVEEGQYVISATLNEAYNEAEENVKLGVVASTVEVVNITYGDANGDGVVNGKDLMVLRKYMANFNFATGESTVAVEAGADANGDGTINGKDLMLLRKYMANYNFSTGESTVVLGPTG